MITRVTKEDIWKLENAIATLPPKIVRAGRTFKGYEVFLILNDVVRVDDTANIVVTNPSLLERYGAIWSERARLAELRDNK